jgi:glycine/serine hydroxymethyltransferase
MNIREVARKHGGDELVAKLDAGVEIERDVFKRVTEIVEEKVAGLTDMDEQVALSAVCEALSSALANVVVVTTVKAFDGDRAGGILTAIRSLSGNINQAFEDLDVMAGGVADKITEAAAKGAK